MPHCKYTLEGEKRNEKNLNNGLWAFLEVAANE